MLDKVFTIVLAEYFNYSNVFLAKNIVEFLEHIRMNNHAIELRKSKQPLLDLFTA